MELDRRKRKTQKAIKEAFIALVSEREISKITVKELAERADISRKTFYLNYIDIDDLIEKLEEEIVAEFVKIVQQYDLLELQANPYPFLQNLSEILQKDDIFTKMLLSDTNEGLLKRLKNLFVNGYLSAINESNPEHIQKYKYIITFMVSGLLEIYKEWYLSNKEISLSELCQLAANITYKE